VSVDWIAFTCFPGDHWQGELRHFLHANFGLEGWELRRGWQGYECSARVGEVGRQALVAWGGEGQRGSVHVQLPGAVCALCRNWDVVLEWFECMRARLTRVDLAGDDFTGAQCSVEWAIQQHEAGGFMSGGRKPSARVMRDLDGVAGDTAYVGRRENGKLLRVYEKGKQLGDPASAWVRCELEMRSKDRVLPFEMLLRPAEYLAGAFPCLAFFAEVRERVRAFRERATVSFSRMVEVARLHAGRAINAMLLANDGDVDECVMTLRRSGMPSRLCRAEVDALSASGDVGRVFGWCLDTSGRI
jgi:phage replication initiation protein